MHSPAAAITNSQQFSRCGHLRDCTISSMIDVEQSSSSISCLHTMLCETGSPVSYRGVSSAAVSHSIRAGTNLIGPVCCGCSGIWLSEDCLALLNKGHVRMAGCCPLPLPRQTRLVIDYNVTDSTAAMLLQQNQILTIHVAGCLSTRAFAPPITSTGPEFGCSVPLTLPSCHSARLVS